LRVSGVKYNLVSVTYDRADWMLSTFIYPRLGSRPIAEITAPVLPLFSEGVMGTATLNAGAIADVLINTNRLLQTRGDCAIGAR
jgi:hypothetical protein